jgi:hypothetical protein
MSLLGSEFDIKGYSIKPFYLVLGLLCLSALFICLGLVYSYYYIKYTLVEYIKDIKIERNRWNNKK